MDKEELKKCCDYFHNLSTEVPEGKRVTKIWDQYGHSVWEESSGEPMPEFYAELFKGARVLELPAK